MNNEEVDLKKALLYSFLIVFVPLMPFILFDVYKSYVKKEW